MNLFNIEKVVSLDFETTYSKERSITTMGAFNYLRDPETDIYMAGVSVLGGETSAGEPSEYADLLEGATTIVCHNAAFDKACYERLVELGVLRPTNARWVCTADMCAVLGYPRNLKDASLKVLGIEASKDTRNKMIDKTWAEMQEDPAFAQEALDYCAHDARLCLKLYETLIGRMPEIELKVSEHTRMMTSRGVAIDTTALEDGIDALNRELTAALLDIPWTGEYAPLSPTGLGKACIAAGIPKPESLAKDDPAFNVWLEKYGEDHLFARAMGKFRSSNALHKKLTALQARVTDGNIFKYGLKYSGGHTGRFSGDSGFNVQNLPRGEMFGVNIRHLIKPREGKKFIITDLAQIEQRVISWLAGDGVMMKLLATGISPYEAYARKSLGYNDPEDLKKKDPQKYQLAKAIVLGLGYGAGALTFARVAKSMAGLEINSVQAKKLVDDFRRSNPLIVKLWGNMERKMRLSRNADCCIYPLPSGRNLHYYDVRQGSKGLTATVHGRNNHFYGGKLTENITQAVARDVLIEAILRIEEAGYPVVMHIHDEIIVEVDADKAEELMPVIHELMKTPPTWLVGCPLDAETFIADHYKK